MRLSLLCNLSRRIASVPGARLAFDSDY
jgi:hypothetical protein